MVGRGVYVYIYCLHTIYIFICCVIKFDECEWGQVAFDNLAGLCWWLNVKWFIMIKG